MQAIIDVFRMTEVSPTTRAKIIVQLGTSINNQFGANLTEGLVYELVNVLNPDHEILKDIWYQHCAGLISQEEWLIKHREAKDENAN